MFKTLIIEDEKPAARRLQRLVEENGLEVVALLHSVNQSVNWLSQNEVPDLLFLDIQLSDGLSFEIFDQINIKVPVIFTTAYDSYTLKAFKLNSVDYLLKPIDPDELKNSIDKFKNNHQINRESLAVEIQKIKTLLMQNTTYKERFSVYIGSSIKLVEATDIECFASTEKATFIHTFQGKSFAIDGSLEQIYTQINPKDFFKVSRKYIINLNAISEIMAYSSNRLQIKLKNFREEEIIVSRERVRDFKEWIS